ncbi:MAG: crossover junction endodeoxyribonuclease RuvC [Armatimonadetes bacterium]|nr:crossover junction endodeoxyribonuclease RuvC [Armatimonadota bacterium]
MVLLGIDPGLASTGWGVVRREGARYASLGYGCLRTPAGEELGLRLLTIHNTVTALIREHRPEVLVMEHLYQLRDGSVGLSVGQAVGVVRLAAVQVGLPIAEYSPTHVKLTLVGNGQADKHQVEYMVQRLLNLPQPPRPDHAADALALCITHVHSGLSRAAAPGQTSAGAGAGDRIAAALAADEARRREHLKETAEEPS